MIRTISENLETAEICKKVKTFGGFICFPQIKYISLNLFKIKKLE